MYVETNVRSNTQIRSQVRPELGRTDRTPAELIYIQEVASKLIDINLIKSDGCAVAVRDAQIKRPGRRGLR